MIYGYHTHMDDANDEWRKYKMYIWIPYTYGGGLISKWRKYTLHLTLNMIFSRITSS